MSETSERIDGERTRRRTGHEEVWDLLPWYVNATLEAAEARAVEEHAQGCGICREEIRYWRGFAGALREEGELAVSADAGLERLRGRLAGGAPGGAGAGERSRRSRKSGGRARRWTTALRRTPAPLRWALAAQLVLILGLAGLLAGPLLEDGAGITPGGAAAFSDGPGPAGAAEPAPAGPFRTLADEPEVAAGGDALLLRVLFTDRTREREIRGALISVGGRIVDGPSPTGVYTVAVAGAAEGAAAVETLRSLPQVLFAERAAGSPESP